MESVLTFFNSINMFINCVMRENDVVAFREKTLILSKKNTCFIFLSHNNLSVLETYMRKLILRGRKATAVFAHACALAAEQGKGREELYRWSGFDRLIRLVRIEGKYPAFT